MEVNFNHTLTTVVDIPTEIVSEFDTVKTNFVVEIIQRYIVLAFKHACVQIILSRLDLIDITCESSLRDGIKKTRVAVAVHDNRGLIGRVFMKTILGDFVTNLALFLFADVLGNLVAILSQSCRGQIIRSSEGSLTTIIRIAGTNQTRNGGDTADGRRNITLPCSLNSV